MIFGSILWTLLNFPIVSTPHFDPLPEPPSQLLHDQLEIFSANSDEEEKKQKKI